MSRSVVVAVVCASGLAMSGASAARPTVSWSNAAGGSWATGTNWSGGAAPTSADDALIDLLGGGPYTITLNAGTTIGSLTLNSANATLAHTSGTLEFNGGDLTRTAGTYNLTGGTISGARLAGVSFTTPNGSAGTLANVTVGTTLNVGSGYTLNIASGLDIEAGQMVSMNSGGGFCVLDFLGSGDQAVAGEAEIVFNGTSSNSFVRANGGTLVIEEGMVIRSGTQGGQVGQLGAMMNKGTIASRTNGKTITVAGNGGWVSADMGTLEASGGGTLTLHNGWTNTGSLVVNNGTMNLGGSFASASVDPALWTRTGGTVNITGTMNNTGQTFTLNAQTGSFVLASGTIVGGTLATADGSQFTTLTGTSGTFSGGVTLDTDFVLSPSYTLNVNGGLTIMNGRTLSLNSGGGFTVLDMLGSGDQALLGEGEVVLNGTTNNGYIRANAGTLVIGPAMTIRTGTQGGQVGQFGTMRNEGLISSQTAGRTLTLNSSTQWSNTENGVLEAKNGGTLTLNGAWANAGMLALDNGTMNLGGTFSTGSVAPGRWSRSGGTANITGTMTNTNSTFVLNGQTGTINLTGGTINGGSITTADGAALGLPGNSSGTLSGGVTVNTDLTMGAGYTLFVNGGLKLGAGRTISMASGASFTVIDMLGAGEQKIEGGEIVFNGTATTGYVRANSGTLVVDQNVTVRTGTQGGFVGQLGALVNKGTILSQTQGRTVTIAGTNIHNEGVIRVENGGTLTIARAGGLSSNSGDQLTARSGGTIRFNSGYDAAGTGTIRLEASSASQTLGYGRMAITGNAAINGTDIDFALTNGFTPDWGDTFNILTYSALLGDMSTLVLPTLSDPFGLRWWRAQTATSYSVGVRIVADTNHDGVVDFLDLNNVLSFFGQSGVGLAGDADENGLVDFIDLNFVLSDFGRSAPVNPVPAPTGVALAMMGLGLAGGRRRRTGTTGA